ncbi:MAG: hypothetical protein KIT31_40480, partial [Deltaproteobacteria bacterium]|nr:hypothetical protein [Deltaproteobacteria bacterium]
MAAAGGGRRRGWKRGRPDGENAFSLARRFTLAAITPSPDELDDDLDLDGHLLEPAWDGHRVLATRAGDDVRLASADFRDWTASFPSAARGLCKLAATTLAIDGVLCVFDERGVPSFPGLRAQVAAGSSGATLICWDLLSIDGEDLRGQPLAARRARRAELLAGAPAN